MIKVGIVDGMGYTDMELLRLLAQYSQARVEVVTSRSETGVKAADMYPNLRGHYDDLQSNVPDVQRLDACDVMLFTAPYGVAHMLAGKLLSTETRVTGLSADFRLADAEEWMRWYGQPHGAPVLLDEAVYGLPGVNREKIRQVRLTAMPDCYPATTQLGLIPPLEAGLADASRLIADCKSGVSGVGRGVKVGSLFCEAGENMMAYAVKGHRHLPEISQGLCRVSDGEAGLTFVLHLTPMIHGVHATPCAHVADHPVDPRALFEKRYIDEPSADAMPADSHPETHNVRGASVCRIAVHRPQSDDLVVVPSVTDNLTKGASGQAPQNMNILFGPGERLGLSYTALLP